MGMPLRILKLAMDFLARVITGLLPGDLTELHRGRVQQLGVLAGFAHADIHHHFLQPSARPWGFSS